MKLIIALIALSAVSCHHQFFKQFMSTTRILPQFVNSDFAPQVEMPFEKLFSKLNKIQMKMSQNKIQTSKIMIIEQAAPSSKYDACLDDIEVILKKVVDMARLCLDQKWQDTIPVFLDTMKVVSETVMCFQHASQVQLGVDPQCVIEHVKLVVADAQLVMADIQAQDWNNLMAHAQELVQHLMEIRDC